MHTQCKNEKKERKANWLILLFLLILLLFGIAAIILLRKDRCNQNGDEPPVPSENTGGGLGLVIDEHAQAHPSYEPEAAVNQNVVIAGWESLTIPAGKTEADVDFFNPEENAQLYYLTFELRLFQNNREDYEVLYTSGLVEPGKHIGRITLSRKLKKGVYEAVIHVQPYRMNEKKTPTNNADIRIRLIVE